MKYVQKTFWEVFLCALVLITTVTDAIGIYEERLKC